MITAQDLANGIGCRGECRLCNEAAECAQSLQRIRNREIPCDTCGGLCNSVFLRIESGTMNTLHCSEKCATEIVTARICAYQAMLTSLENVKKTLNPSCHKYINSVMTGVQANLTRATTAKITKVR